MAGILEQLLSGGSFGGALTGVGPTGPQVPFGGVEKANAAANIDPQLLSALGFLGGGGGGMSPGILQLLSGIQGGGLPGQSAGGGASPFGAGLGGLLGLAQGDSPKDAAGGGSLGILGLLAGLGR